MVPKVAPPGIGLFKILQTFNFFLSYTYIIFNLLQLLMNLLYLRFLDHLFTFQIPKTDQMEHCVTWTTILHLTLYLLSSVRPVVYMEKILCCTAKYVKMLNIQVVLWFLVLLLWCMVICFIVIHFSLIAIELQLNLNVNGRLKNCYLD